VDSFDVAVHDLLHIALGSLWCCIRWFYMLQIWWQCFGRSFYFYFFLHLKIKWYYATHVTYQ
jgi:hypothetical protein